MKAAMFSALVALVAACARTDPDGSEVANECISYGDAGALPACQSRDDCMMLKPGPCGWVDCDVYSLVGAPQIHGVPKGCFITVDETCGIVMMDAGADAPLDAPPDATPPP